MRRLIKRWMAAIPNQPWWDLVRRTPRGDKHTASRAVPFWFSFVSRILKNISSCSKRRGPDEKKISFKRGGEVSFRASFPTITGSSIVWESRSGARIGEMRGFGDEIKDFLDWKKDWRGGNSFVWSSSVSGRFKKKFGS